MHDHDRGLSHDLPLLTRRRALGAIGGLGLLLAGCGSSDDGTGAAAAPASTADA